ncbi:unnamed protein product [Toxocara canis]|uniref:Protein Ric1 n=1 Tax=Toxocara canis TaxID=6265 RepID=A0A183UF47_TOXCA|nr:unnamed protein product [Toxocara canis]
MLIFGRTVSLQFVSPNKGIKQFLSDAGKHRQQFLKRPLRKQTVDVRQTGVQFQPVGVFVEKGCSVHLAINILLTILGYFPGLIHAIIIICYY